MQTLIRYLLWLYPKPYRHEFAEEMLGVFVEANDSQRQRVLLARMSFCLREITGLISGALREHVRAATGYDYVPLRRSPMQDRYRFPKSTAIFMSLSLLAVVIAMVKANAIVLQYGEQLRTNIPGWAGTFSICVAVVLVVVAIVLAVLSALHATGAQRLERLNSWPAEK